MSIEKNKFVSLFTKFINNTNRFSDSIRNNAIGILDKKTRLNSIIEDFDLGHVKVFLPPKNTRLNSWRKWQKYLQEGDIAILSENDVYNLAFEYSALDDERYLNIFQTNKFYTDDILFALVRNLHYFWTDLEKFELVCITINKFLKSLESEKKIIKKWRKKPDIILGTKALSLEKIFLMELRHKFLNFDFIYSNKLYYVQKNDLLINLVQYEYISELFQKKDIWENFDKTYDLFLEFFNYSIKPVFRIDDSRSSSKTLIEKRNLLLAELILLIHSKKKNDYYKSKLIEFILTTPIFGDPRTKEWFGFKYQKALEVVKIWLNEQDIEFFFDNLIDEDPHDRKGFWVDYADKVDSVMFIIGNDVPANLKNYNNISLFTKNASKNVFKVGCDTNFVKSNVFIISIGDLVILEFSESGHACYIYSSEYYKKEICHLFSSRFARANFKLANLKSKDKCVMNIRHDKWGNWQSKIKEFLNSYL